MVISSTALYMKIGIVPGISNQPVFLFWKIPILAKNNNFCTRNKDFRVDGVRS